MVRRLVRVCECVWSWCVEELRFVALWFRTLDAQLARGAIYLGPLPPSLVPRDAAALEPIPSGSRDVDDALGGGWPRGKLVELLGPPGIGKSAFAWRAVQACVKAGGIACYVDVDAGLAGLVQGEPQGVFVICPGASVTGDDAWGIIEALLEGDVVDLVVVDAINGLIAEEEQEVAWGEGFDSWQRARWLGRALYRLQAPLRHSRTTLLCVRQTTPEGEPPCTERVQGQTLPLLADVRVALQPTAVGAARLGERTSTLWLFKSPSERGLRQLA